MVSSLELGNSQYQGPQVAPDGSQSSFLTVGSTGPKQASPNLRTMLRKAPAGIAYSSGTPIGEFDIRHFPLGTFTDETIGKMHEAVLAAKTDAGWRALMEDIRREGRQAGSIGWKDYLGEVAWFNHWYRNVHPIDYVRDPDQIEMVMHPRITYQKQLGDCDDSSSLLAASLSSLGAPYRFRTYMADPAGRPGEATHVAAQINVPGYGWINNDLTLKDVPFGYEPPGFEYKDWPEPRRG